MLDFERLDVVRTTTLAIANARSSTGVYEEALRGLSRGLGDLRCSLSFFDSRGVMRFRAWRGLSVDYRTAVEGHSPWRPGQTDAEPILVSDVEREPELAPYLAAIRSEGIGAMAMIPLVVGGGVIGKFMLYREPGGGFDAGDVQLAQAIAAVTAFAIDRQQAVDALEAERRLFMGGPTMVFRWRNEAGWPVEYVSPNVLSQLGYRPEQLTTGEIPYGSIVHADDLARVADEVASAVANGQPCFEQQYRVRRADGVFRTIYDFTIVVRQHGEATHFQGYALDVTEREIAETALRDAEKRLSEVRRLESLGLLAGSIAHDFNNLLVGILGNATLTIAELPEGSAARGTLETILSAGHRAAGLTRQLLAYSGKGAFLIEPVDVGALAREAGQLFIAQVARGATMVYEIAPDLPRVEADATQLRQVFLNLLTNSYEASEGRPLTVTIAVRRSAAPHGELAVGDYVAIEVRDDGIGMDEETKQRIFEPFFTTKFHGRGLGMAAVLGVTKGHRGAIRIESTKGRGTIATIHLPVRRPESRKSTPPGPHTPVEAPAASGALLVVDDEKLVRGLTARALAMEGFEVYEAENGAVALQQLGALPQIRVVLLDLTMPVLSGEATLRTIRARWPKVQVILSSGFNADSSSSVRDADGFIQKPYLTEDLIDMIKGMLAKSSEPQR